MGWSRKGRSARVGGGIGRGGTGSPGWKVLALVAVGLTGGCGNPRAYDVQLLTDTCTGTPALEGVRYLRFRVTGEGMEPVERYAEVERGSAGAPGVPPGRGRVLEVRGYTELPRSGGRVVALGRSRPFDVPSSAQAEVSRARVAVRRVGEYARPGSPVAGCQALVDSRAAHTATRLADGRVLLAGGYQLDSDGAGTTLASVEVFDPVMGTLARAPDLEEPRAFHTATRLPDGQVLLAGGERDPDAKGGPRPLRSARVLDVAAGTSAAVELGAARTRHAAAADAQGRVLLAGGTGLEGKGVSMAEGYSPGTGRVFSVGTPVPRVGLGMLPVGDGRRLAVVGGLDGTQPRPEVVLFAYEGDTFVPVGEGGRLREPRRDGALVAFGGAGRLLYVGGETASGDAGGDKRMLGSSQILTPDEPSRGGAGPVVFARTAPCAVTLPDGRVMTVGGLSETYGERTSDARAELLVDGQEGRAPVALGVQSLEHPRHQHTCTVLEDGAVLIVGGLEDEGGRQATLGDLVLYMPAPLD